MYEKIKKLFIFRDTWEIQHLFSTLFIGRVLYFPISLSNRHRFNGLSPVAVLHFIAPLAQQTNFSQKNHLSPRLYRVSL